MGIKVLLIGISVVITVLTGYFFINYRHLIPDTPPTSIRSVSAYKIGSDAQLVCLIFENEAGSLTTAKGKLALDIVEEHNQRDITGWLIKKETLLYSRIYPIDKSMFIKKQVGVGVFTNKVLTLHIGAIPYSAFIKRPSAMTGEVRVVFIPDSGVTLRGNTTIYFE